jgi:hypothetical protein
MGKPRGFFYARCYPLVDFHYIPKWHYFNPQIPRDKIPEMEYGKTWYLGILIIFKKYCARSTPEFQGTVHAYGSCVWFMAYGIWFMVKTWAMVKTWSVVYGLPVPWDYNYHGYYIMFHSILFRGSSRTIFRPRKNKKTSIYVAVYPSKNDS